MTDDELTALEKLCADATPGPWVWLLDGGRTWASSLVSKNVKSLGRESHSPVLSTAKTGLMHLCNEVAAYIVSMYGDDDNDEEIANFEFIAAARTALPLLIAEVRRLRTAQAPIVEKPP